MVIYAYRMEPLFSCLHPNPGWNNPVSCESSVSTDTSENDLVGKHCILELYDCNKAKLNDEAFLRTTVTIAAKLAGATLLNLITHRFKPQGVTGLALLAESHISIHTWPENSYAAVDVFTCGNHTDPELACKVLIEELSAKNYSLKSFKREGPKALPNTLRDPALNNFSSYC